MEKKQSIRRLFGKKDTRKQSISQAPAPIPEQEPIETISSPLPSSGTASKPTSAGPPAISRSPTSRAPPSLPSRKSSLQSRASASSSDSNELAPPHPTLSTAMPGAALPNLTFHPASPLSPQTPVRALVFDPEDQPQRPPLQSRFSADSSILDTPLDIGRPATPELDHSRSSIDSVSSPALSFRSVEPASVESSSSLSVAAPPRPALSPNRSRTIVRPRSASSSSTHTPQLLTPPLPEGAMSPAMSRTSSASSLRSVAIGQSKFVTRDPALPLTESPLSLLALGIILASGSVAAKQTRRSSTPSEELHLLANARQEADRMYRAVKEGPKLVMLGPD